MARYSAKSTCVFIFIVGVIFNISTGVPLDNRIDAADVDTISYELFTRNNPTTAQLLRVNDTDALSTSNFKSNLPTKVYVHGWTSGPGAGYESRDGWLQVGDYNVISMNWSEMATGPLIHPADYPFIAEIQVPKAGKNLGQLIDLIVSQTGVAISSFHLIGHSLGSHVVGWAGSTVNGRISRITGLDPAGPFYFLNNTENRLDPSDADFVDIIHTDGGNLYGGQLAFFEPTGHVDYYPNGGKDQPGCINVLGFGCDHQRAVDYFGESITTKVGFRAFKCLSFDELLETDHCTSLNVSDMQLMGEPTPNTARGIYYLTTNFESPYALG